MPSQRRSGDTAVKQPVRFYKFIALSFLFITIVLFGAILFMSSKRAEITVTAKSSPIEASFSVTVGASDSPISGKVAKATVPVELSFTPEGGKETPAQAQGSVVIKNDSSRDQPLVATTRLLSADGVLFRLRKGLTAPAGGSVEASVYADEVGAGGNIGPAHFTIPGLNPARQQEVYADSASQMDGGVRNVGLVTQSDVARAEKVVFDEAKQKAAEQFAKDYPVLAMRLVVASQNLVSSAAPGDEAAEFTVSGDVEVVGVVYSQEELLAHARAALERQVVGESEVLQFVASEPAVSIASFDPAAGSAVLNVIGSGRVSLDANSPALEKSSFFGKDESDVRRYALSLGNVEGVRVSFRPFWNRSVPHVPDHVVVVVRQVE